MIGHTPGPWLLQASDLDEASVYVPSRHGRYVIAERIGGQVHKSETGRFDDYSEVEANCHLIAAAPDLLEALQSLVASLSDQDDEGLIEHAEPMQAARAALTRAGGSA